MHHFEDLRELVEDQGMHLRYLPPYSPDLNPIEQGFSVMKAWIHKNNDYVLGELTGDDT
jgi:transposase